jgi:cytochrome P450
LGNRSFITYPEAMDLKYCSCIFKETLRLYPPTPLLLRVNTEEMNVNSYHIPRNSVVSVSSYVAARYEKYFPNPLDFKPERFMKDADTLESS